MGVWDWLFGTQGGQVAGELNPPYPSAQAAIDAYVAERMGAGPLTLPAVERGVELLASAVAQLTPVAYRDGVPMEQAPRIVERPDPWTTRYAFLFTSVRSMVELGAAAWYLFDEDPETRRPRSARVIPLAEVELGWDDARFLPTYTWRGRRMKPGVDFAYVPLAPRAGELAGVSPLVACERALAAITYAELYAAGFFAGSGVPSGTLTYPGELTDDEADHLSARWAEKHAGPVPTPAVLSGGVTWEREAANPEEAQLVDTREQGVATVARLLGIPAPLLIVSMGGTSITYANVSQLYAELHRSTVIPLYLQPLEAALSDLTPRNTAVRFDLAELTRLDVASRWDVYAQAAALGVLDSSAIALREGIVPAQPPATLAPSPAAPSPAVPEVPAV